MLGVKFTLSASQLYRKHLVFMTFKGIFPPAVFAYQTFSVIKTCTKKYWKEVKEIGVKNVRYWAPGTFFVPQVLFEYFGEYLASTRIIF